MEGQNGKKGQGAVPLHTHSRAKKVERVQQLSVKYTGSDGFRGKPCVIFYVSTAAVQVKFYKLISVLRVSLLLEDAKLEDTFVFMIIVISIKAQLTVLVDDENLKVFLILLLLNLVMEIFQSPKSCLSTSLSVYMSVFLSRDGIRSSRGKAEHLHVGIVTKI